MSPIRIEYLGLAVFLDTNLFESINVNSKLNESLILRSSICHLASLCVGARCGECACGDGALLLEEDAAAGARVAPRVAAVPQQDLLQRRRRGLLQIKVRGKYM